MRIRRPQVAGSFYPSDPSELEQFCKTALVSAKPSVPAHAVLLPHAGYIYSGQVAASVLSQIDVPEKNLMIGPNHRGLGSDFAVFSEGFWETPLGRIPVNQTLAAALLESSQELTQDEDAHTYEHSLEVLLPLLQTKNPQLQIIPLLVGTLDFETARKAALPIGEVLQTQKQRVLTIISSDMNHYESDEATRKKDRYALDAIKNLDASALLHVIREHNISMCGMVPAYMLLAMKEQLGIRKARFVDYRTSADATGEKDRVVGYAGFIFEG